eukprot:5613638-Pyramimonas_sp.AAC.1
MVHAKGTIAFRNDGTCCHLWKRASARSRARGGTTPARCLARGGALRTAGVYTTASSRAL